MDSASVKMINDFIRTLSADLKVCRAAEQILDGFVRLNSSRDGVSVALVEVQAAAEQLVKNARAFTKHVQELSASVASAPAIGDADPGSDSK